MATPRNFRERRLRGRPSWIGTAIICATLAGIAALAVIATSGSSSRRGEPFDGLSVTEAELLKSAITASVDASRPDYPFSVISRGVYNANELGAAMARDHVVAAHYKAVSLDKIRAERVTEPRYAYVSYRKGNDIFWTKNRVRLNPGEMVLTDGETQIRARCGNCISTQPMLPTSDEEPESVTLEPLLPPDEAQDGVPLVASFPIIPPFSGIPGLTQVNSPQDSGGGIGPGGFGVGGPGGVGLGGGLRNGSPGGTNSSNPSDAPGSPGATPPGGPNGPNDPGDPDGPSGPNPPNGPNGPSGPNDPNNPPGAPNNPPGGPNNPPGGPNNPPGGPNNPPGGPDNPPGGPDNPPGGPDNPPGGPDNPPGGPDNPPGGPYNPPGGPDNPPPSIPEPTTVLLMGTGLAGLALRRLRNQR